MPYPTPQVIGPELVTNGTDWTGATGNTPPDNWSTTSTTIQFSVSNGDLTVDRNGEATAYDTSQNVTTVAGNVYELYIDMESYIGVGALRVSIDGVAATYSTLNGFSVIFSAVDTSTTIGIRNTGADDVSVIREVSVKEITPRGLAIAMDGLMTYADNTINASLNGGGGEVLFYLQKVGISDYLEAILNTFAGTGRVDFNQEVSGVRDTVVSSSGYHSPGINVPFSIASRHGDNFVNGAVDGTALTANLTPTILPDLSSTPIQIGSTFNGFINTLRVWDVDIGDAGIAEAST